MIYDIIYLNPHHSTTNNTVTAVSTREIPPTTHVAPSPSTTDGVVSHLATHNLYYYNVSHLSIGCNVSVS
jgi:hypothetical protein